MTSAATRWRDQLAAWRIPEPILAAAAESPWVVPTEVFTRRADRYIAEPGGVSYARAAEALDPPGTVLDVGAGAGAASLPLSDRITELVAVDTNTGMLTALTERAGPRLNARTIAGRWPDIADDTPTVDVVVCHHVFYNAPDLPEFATALAAHARRRTVVELTERHPLVVLNALWKRFHGLDRPTGPSAADAVAVLREVGIVARAEHWRRPSDSEYSSFEALVDVTRRRLCLPPERADEVGAALIAEGVDPARPRDLGSSGRDLVTLWWDAQPVGR